MKEKIILIAELALCGFAMYGCIDQWVNSPGNATKGTSPVNFFSYIVLAIFFIVLYFSGRSKKK